MRVMDGAIKRVLRVHRNHSEYFLGIVDDIVFTTLDINSARDFSHLSLEEVLVVEEGLRNKGYTNPQLVVYGLRFVDEYGVERFYEKPFQRTTIEDLIAFTDDYTREEE